VDNFINYWLMRKDISKTWRTGGYDQAIIDHLLILTQKNIYLQSILANVYSDVFCQKLRPEFALHFFYKEKIR